MNRFALLTIDSQGNIVNTISGEVVLYKYTHETDERTIVEETLGRR